MKIWWVMRVEAEAYLGYMTDFTKKLWEKYEPFSLNFNEKIHYGIRNNRKIEPFMGDFVRFRLPRNSGYIGHNRVDEFKDLETDHYKITRHKKSGYISIYNKKSETKVIMHSLQEIIMQVDEKTGIRLLINDFGAGVYNCLQVGLELEWALKESLGTKLLNWTIMEDFKIHTSEKSGITYITCNGYESLGGHLLLNYMGREKIISWANEYLKKYPSVIKSEEEAIMFTVCEVTGVGKHITAGLLMLGPNAVSFYNTFKEERWRIRFDKKKYNRVRKEWDNKTDYLLWDSKQFWKAYFKKRLLEYEEIESADLKIVLKEYLPDRN